MGLFDMFDKLDDIVFAPVQAVCDWIHEPLRRMEHKRELASQDHSAKQQADLMKAEADIAYARQQQDEKLRQEQVRFQAEMDSIYRAQELEHNNQLVEAVKRYQIDLASAIQQIVENVGLMSLSLRAKANDLVLEKTQSYIAIQEKAKQQSKDELAEAKEMFAEDDPETYRMLVKQILMERQSMVDMAGKFITELSEDLKRLNQNSDMLLQQGMTAVTEALSPLTATLALQTSAAADRSAAIAAESNPALTMQTLVTTDTSTPIYPDDETIADDECD